MIRYPYGIDHLRSIKEIQPINGLSPLASRQEIIKRSTDSDYFQNIRLAYRRSLPKEISQEGSKAGSSSKEEKEFLRYKRYPYIIQTYG